MSEKTSPRCHTVAEVTEIRKWAFAQSVSSPALASMGDILKASSIIETYVLDGYEAADDARNEPEEVTVTTATKDQVIEYFVAMGYDPDAIGTMVKRMEESAGGDVDHVVQTTRKTRPEDVPVSNVSHIGDGKRDSEFPANGR
jgi:hypothetical protein